MYAKPYSKKMEYEASMNSKTELSDFKSVADSVFGTLLTITTLLSGLYIGMAFGWFEGAIGEATTPDMIQQATIGIVVSLVFILPLVLVLMAWALSKFSGSIKWRNVAWSGLIYCLTQDFIGLVAMFVFSLMMAGAINQGVTSIVLPLVVSIPPVLGVVFGYRVSSRYTPDLSKRRHALTALITIITLLSIQATLALIGIRFGDIL